jgi:formate-dependent nitrite reductase membrane component NrfD
MTEPTPAAATPVKPPAKDPMKSFRGVMAGSLIMEGIAVALALPVVAKLNGGIGTGTGVAIIAIAVALVVLCGMIKRPWAVPAVLVLQVALIAFFFAVPAVAVLGFVFLAFWLWILWLRRDVARRMAEGRLPSQQQSS